MDDQHPLRQSLPPMPARIASLPLDHRGFPIPWFVGYIDGKPDFRCIGEGKIGIAHNRRLCWVCGQLRGVYGAFVIGPMCAINRTISEPPSHLECAVWSARACPFLSKPNMRRNEKNLPADAQEPAGVGLKRNPGSTCVWVTKSYKPWRPKGGGVLFELGEPENVYWFCEGRTATRAEVQASIDSGLHLLLEPAREEGPEAVAALYRYIECALPLLPAA